MHIKQNWLVTMIPNGHIDFPEESLLQSYTLNLGHALCN